DEILESDDLGSDEFDVPRWGTRIRLEEPTQGEMRALRGASNKPVIRDAKVVEEFDAELFAKKVWCKVIVKPRFSEEKYDRLSKKAPSIVNYVFGRIWRLLRQDVDAEATLRAMFPAGDGHSEGESGGLGGGDGVSPIALASHDAEA